MHAGGDAGATGDRGAMRSEKFPVTNGRQNASMEHEDSYPEPLQAAMNAASDGSLRAGTLLNQPGQSAGVPDAALAEAAQRGEKRAFLEIVVRHQAMVYGIAFSILGDFAASEDAAQEAFLTAWRKIHDLRDADRLKAWLGQIARTSAHRYQRNRRGGGPVEEWIDQTDPAPQPDEAAASEEEAALVREALAKLPESFRLPLILYYCDGQSVKRVAETLELSEDAVKQRLARGRGMMRDRMSGLIETVLTRAQPTAAFTMMIAAAIGALAAPTAIAGTAFTTAAGATGTTSTTASSAVTAMSTAKTSLTIAALVAAACLPLGYGARISMESSAAAPPLNGSDRQAALQKSGPDFPRNTLFDEWRKLHARLGSTAEAMPLLYDAIADLKDPVRQRIFHTAQIAEWAEVAPETGLAFFLERASREIGRNANRIHYGELTQFFNEWMLRDADAAVNALVASGGNWKTLALLSLQEVAKRVPGRLADIASQLPNSNNARDERVRDAFAIMAEGSLESARIAAEGTSGFYREQALAGVAKAWGKTDMAAAIAWAKSLPDDVNHDAIIRGALMGAAAVKPETALDKVKSISPGGQKSSRNSTGALVLEEAAKADYDATVAWLTKHPAELGAEETLGMNSAVRDRLHADAAGFLNRHAADGSLSVLMPSILSVVSNQAGQHAAIWEWLKTQTDSDAVTQLRQRIITTTGYQQPELALKMVTDFPATKEGDAWVERIASCLLTDYRLNRFDDLMAKAPERLRQPLLNAAFDNLNGARLMNSGIDDPQKWLARVALAPEARRADLTSNVAAAWAARAPEEAVAWVTTLPDDTTRSSALAAVASGWIAKDAYGASEWITTFPAGPDKDRAADALVKAIAMDSPEEAWQWTLSIADPALRANSVLQSLTAMQKRDPVTARQWLESAPVSAQEREQFRTELNAGSAKPK